MIYEQMYIYVADVSAAERVSKLIIEKTAK